MAEYKLKEQGVREYLASRNWPEGLQAVAVKEISACPIRYFIADDSGSMSKTDAVHTVREGEKVTAEACSRWTELLAIVKFCAGLARAGHATTEFRLMNHEKPVIIGSTTDHSDSGYHKFIDLINAVSPSGPTPLCRHVNEVVSKIKQQERSLKAHHQKCALIIATDGEADDGDTLAMLDAMRPLRELPVKVVIRLCSNEDWVIEYWKNIEKQLEIEFEFVNDLTTTATKVDTNNNWFTYGEPIHLLKHFGVFIGEFKDLENKPLNPDEIRDACAIILGGQSEDYPQPAVDLNGFLKVLNDANADMPVVFNAATRKMSSWFITVHMRKAVRGYKDECLIC